MPLAQVEVLIGPGKEQRRNGRTTRIAQVASEHEALHARVAVRRQRVGRGDIRCKGIRAHPKHFGLGQGRERRV